MAKKDQEVIEVVPVDEVEGDLPRFRDAVLGIRSFKGLMAVAKNPDYNPHVHIMILLSITALVAIVGYITGA